MSRLHDNHIVRYMLSFVDAVFPDGRFVSESDTSESEFTPEQCSCLCIVQELCDGTLKEHLSNGTIKKLSAEERLIILQQITEGLKYLHSKNFVHADLKPDNVLVLDETWKVSDFGLAHAIGVGDDFAAGDAGDVVMPGFYRPPASEVRDQQVEVCKTQA
ncbi:unnamed protein product [Malus baccata var. baccata]